MVKIIRQTSIGSFETSWKQDRSINPIAKALRNLEIYSRDAHQGFRVV